MPQPRSRSREPPSSSSQEMAKQSQSQEGYFPFLTVCHRWAYWSEVSFQFISFTLFERESFAHGHGTGLAMEIFHQNKWHEMKLAELFHSSGIIWFVSSLGCPALKFACERLDLCSCSSPLLSLQWHCLYRGGRRFIRRLQTDSDIVSLKSLFKLISFRFKLFLFKSFFN